MNAVYTFGLLDPRKIPAADATNDSLLGDNTLGIEVTVPELAKRCGLGNIDPQHTVQSGTPPAAIEAVLEMRLPPAGSRLVTVRADLDSICSMALLEIRANNLNLTAEHGLEVIRRIKEIAIFDKFARGQWPGEKPLPSTTNPWPGGADEHKLSILGAAVSDFKVPLPERVQAMTEYLLAGKMPEKYIQPVEDERQNLINALNSGDVSMRLDSQNKNIAIIETTHRAATTIGYTMAPIVVAVNPKMKMPNGSEVRKVTICQFTDGYVDFKKLQNFLNELEPGWGGSPSILGSPQGISTTLSVDTLIGAVNECIKVPNTLNYECEANASSLQTRQSGLEIHDVNLSELEACLTFIQTVNLLNPFRISMTHSVDGVEIDSDKRREKLLATLGDCFAKLSEIEEPETFKKAVNFLRMFNYDRPKEYSEFYVRRDKNQTYREWLSGIVYAIETGKHRQYYAERHQLRAEYFKAKSKEFFKLPWWQKLGRIMSKSTDVDPRKLSEEQRSQLPDLLCKGIGIERIALERDISLITKLRQQRDALVAHIYKYLGSPKDVSISLDMKVVFPEIPHRSADGLFGIEGAYIAISPDINITAYRKFSKSNSDNTTILPSSAPIDLRLIGNRLQDLAQRTGSKHSQTREIHCYGDYDDPYGDECKQFNESFSCATYSLSTLLPLIKRALGLDFVRFL